MAMAKYVEVTNETTLRDLGDRDLLQQLIYNAGHAAKVRKVLIERITRSGYANLYDYIRADDIPPITAGMPKKNPEMPSFSEENYLEVYRYVLETKWNGLGMTDPEDALDGMRTAVQLETPWEDLPDGAQRFYKSVRYHFNKWHLKQQRA